MYESIESDRKKTRKKIILNGLCLWGHCYSYYTANAIAAPAVVNAAHRLWPNLRFMNRRKLQETVNRATTSPTKTAEDNIVYLSCRCRTGRQSIHFCVHFVQCFVLTKIICMRACVCVDVWRVWYVSYICRFVYLQFFPLCGCC